MCCSWREHEAQRDVARIITLALDATDDIPTYLSSIYSTIAAALVAKRILTAAVTTDAAYDARKAQELCKGLGVHLRFLTGRFGRVAEDQRGRGWLSQRRQTLPASLFEFAQVGSAGFYGVVHIDTYTIIPVLPCQHTTHATTHTTCTLQALYFLQHGPLLAPPPPHHLHHMRDRQALYAATALNAGATTAAGPLLTPCVWVVREGHAALHRPPLMLSLCGEDAVVVDVGVEVFVWVGKDVEAFGGAAQTLQQCMQVVERCCTGDGEDVPLRCPLPLVRKVHDVHVLEEMLGCLNPVQRDPVGVQRGLWLRSVPGGVVPTMDDALASIGVTGKSLHEWAEGNGVALML